MIAEKKALQYTYECSDGTATEVNKSIICWKKG